MFNLATNVAALLFVLGVLVFIHELGHFATAKFFGIRCDVFSLGFGPRLFGFRRGDTDYRVCAIPLGGYVKMAGEDPDADLTGASDEFPSKPKWQRFLVLVNGPLMNVALAFVLFVVVFLRGISVPAYSLEPVDIGLVDPDSPAATVLMPGDRVTAVDGQPVENWQAFELRVLISGGRAIDMTVMRDGANEVVRATPEARGPNQQGYLGAGPDSEPVISRVSEETPAAAAGLEPGDRFVQVEGQPIRYWRDLTAVVRERPGQPTEFVIERDGVTLPMTITPTSVGADDEPAHGVLGVSPGQPTVRQRYNIAGAMGRSANEIRRQTALVGEILQLLFTGRMSLRTLSGPIEIANYSGQAARTGDPFMLFFFMGVVSLQLGLLNLLPIPVLDGGHIAVLAIEGITRHDLSMRFKERMMTIGVVLLVTLMLVVIAFDILKGLGR